MIEVTFSKVVYKTCILSYEGSSCQLEFRKDFVYLGGLYTRPESRGKGSATAILNRAKRIARKLGQPLCLFAGPYADKPKNTEQLLAFYKARGFRLTDGANLEYVHEY